VELSFLRSLLESPGPFVSVYLDTSDYDRGVDAQARQVRWRDQRAELAKEHDDTATLDALGEALARPEVFGVAGVAAFGTHGRVPLVVKLPGVPRREQAHWSRLPDLLPLLAQTPPRPPHLLVSANREGGEVLVVGGAAHGGQQGSDEQQVQGTGWPVHKVKSGGWSQDRYQRSAEEAWETNAKELAAAVVKAAGGQRVEAVIVAGDTRACELLVEKLPDDLRRQAVLVDRELPVDSDELTQAAEEVLQQLEDDGARSHLETFHNQAGTGRAVEGLAGTVAALRDGQVSELFIGGRYTDGDRKALELAWASDPAWVGPGLADLALSEADLRDRNVTDVAQDQVGAALIRAAVGTDAKLFLVPPGGTAAGDTAPREPALRDDIGALLRFAVPGA
jgi:Bacterial archaeo-eukaryotic release factor family 2